MKLHKTRARLLGGVVIAAATALSVGGVAATGAYADTVDGNLPGGTSISVAINSPANGAALQAGSIAASGTASVGEAQPVADTALIYVVDVSGSTTDFFDGCGGNQNPTQDTLSNTRLDCEIAAVKALNATATSNGTVGDVGLVVFGTSAAQADLQPSPGPQPLTAPGADLNANGVPDVVDALVTTRAVDGLTGGISQFTPYEVGYLTNFQAAVNQANALAALAPEPNRLVVFMSDGTSNQSGDAVAAVANRPTGTTYQTFAIGSGASCNDPGSQGSLEQIAAASGGACTAVPDLPSLPDVIPGVIHATLDSLQISVNGGPWDAVTTVPPLPQTGPESVDYTYNLDLSSPGTYNVCVRANGTDAGGSSSVTDCHQILVYNLAPGGGSFAIGSGNSATGSPVTFWSPQWWTLNSPGAGSAPAAFKGYAAEPSTPTCGSQFSTRPGDSPPPPMGPLPEYMAVIVTSHVTKEGPTITGDISHIMVVKTNPGYDPDTGAPGTGTVVGQVC